MEVIIQHTLWETERDEGISSQGFNMSSADSHHFCQEPLQETIQSSFLSQTKRKDLQKGYSKSWLSGIKSKLLATSQL